MALDTRMTLCARAAIMALCCGVLVCATPAIAFADDGGGIACVPTAAQASAYEADGSLAQREAFQESLGNTQADSGLIRQALAREQAERDANARAVPTNWKSGMGTTGPAHVVALRVSFPDKSFEEGDTLEALQNLLDVSTGDPSVGAFPYENLDAYYERASYGRLSLDGQALDYVAQHERAYYTNNVHLLFEEALTSLDATVDFSQFDGNGDGFIDAVYLHFAGGDAGWGTTWWSNEQHYSGQDVELDGKRMWNIVTLHEPCDHPDAVRTIIHETGHVLGLPDYYSYASQKNGGAGARSGLLTFDMMMDNQGDHNGFSKWLLGWIEGDDVVRVVANETGITVKRGSEVIQQLPPASDGDPIAIDQALQAFDTGALAETGGIMVVSNEDKGLFSSYYLLQYDQHAGNQSVGYVDANSVCHDLPSGFRLFRVQAALTEDGSEFVRTNANGSVNDQLIELVDPDMGAQHAAEYGGVPVNIESGTYQCMLFAGDAVTPQSYPSTNFYENRFLGFTGLSIQALASESEQGTVRLSYSGALRPDVGPFAIEQRPARGMWGADTLTFEASSAPLLWAPGDPEMHPSLVVDGVERYATLDKLDGTTISVSYVLDADVLKPDSTCEMVFPARMFLVGRTAAGENVLSPEIRVPVTPGAVTPISASGLYAGTESREGTPSVSDVFEGSDGRLRFFESTNGSLLLHAVAADDPARLETTPVEGVVLSTTGTEFARFQVMPLQGSTVFLELTIGTEATGYWIDEASGAVRASCPIPYAFDRLHYATDGETVMALDWAPGNLTALTSLVPQDDGSVAQHCGWTAATNCLDMDGIRMACVGDGGEEGGSIVRVLDARAVADRLNAGPATFDEAFAAGDLLADLPAQATLRVLGYGLVSDVRPLGEGFAVLAGVPVPVPVDGFPEGEEAAAAYNAVIRFDAAGREMVRTGFASRVDTALFTRLVVSSNGALAATRVEGLYDDPFPSLETVFFESNLQTSTRMFTTSRASGAWWGAHWLAIGWGVEPDSAGGEGSPVLAGAGASPLADGNGEEKTAGYLHVRYDLTVAMDGGLGGGGEGPEPGGDVPAEQPEQPEARPAPNKPKPLSATGDGGAFAALLVAASCAGLAVAASARRLAAPSVLHFPHDFLHHHCGAGHRRDRRKEEPLHRQLGSRGDRGRSARLP